MADDQPAPGTSPTKPQSKPATGSGKKQNRGKAPLTPDERKLVAKSRKEAAKYRTQLREYQAKEAAQSVKDAEDRGEYKALYQSATARAQELEAEVARLKAQVGELTPYRESAETAAQEARAAALAQLPEDIRASFENADAATIQAVAARIAAPGTSPAPQAAPARDPAKAGDPPQPDTSSAAVPGTGGFGEAFKLLQRNKG